MDRFHFLLKQYLAGTISDEEESELMALIKSGRYDEELKRDISQTLQHSAPQTTLSARNAKRLQHRILRSEQENTKLLLAATRYSLFKWGSIAALVLALITAVWLLYWSPPSGSDQKPIAVSTTPGLIEKHGRQFVRLPDSSTVLLNKNSQLNYPDTFKGDTRTVTLIGEGYFDIHPGGGKPFVVQTGKVRVTVLGTAFNIKSYPHQPAVTVTVTRGKVKVTGAGQSYIATANQQIAVEKKSQEMHRELVNAAKAVTWKDRYLIIDNIKFEEALLLIENKYHVEILLTEDSLKQYRISATFLNNETLEQVLTVICGVVRASYTLQPNDRVIIRPEPTP